MVLTWKTAMNKQAQKVKFKKEWFNPLYFIILRLLAEGVKQFYIYGGKSSAKTVSVCQLIAVRCLMDRQNALIFRKESVLIDTTVYPSMKVAIDGTRLGQGWRAMDKMFRGYQGNEIVFKGLDKDEKAKGVEGFSYLLFDELNHFSYEEYDQSLGSFRGEVAKAFFGTWNPVSEDSWVKTKVVDAEEWHEHSELKLSSAHSFVRVNKAGNKCLIKTIYEDNYWTVGSPCGTYGYRDEELLAKYEQWKINDAKFGTQQYWINVIGEWGIIKPENPFFWAYQPSVNKGPTQYDPTSPVLAAFDYNVRNSCTIWQVEEVRNGYNVYCLEELPRQGAELSNEYDLGELAAVVARKYGKRGIKWTGDSTGNSQSGLTPGRKPAKHTIEIAFKKAGIDATYFPISKNPNTDDSREYCNAIFQYQAEQGFDLIIDQDKCPELHSDLTKSQAIDGGKLDKAHCNKFNYGHKSDTARYFLHKFCFQIYKNYKRAA